MDSDLIIHKKRKPVTLWVHPEGLVIGDLYVRAATGEEREQRVIDLLNRDRPFVVLARREPDELRFYHRASILRAEYEAAPIGDGGEMIHHRCQLGMMDGSVVEGTLMRPAPPDRSRLFDFLNRADERFLEVFPDEGPTLAVNKSYVIYVRPQDDD